MFVFDFTEPKTTDVPVKLGDAELTLHLTEPSLDLILDDSGFDVAAAVSGDIQPLHKLKFYGRLRAFTGWTGVNDAAGKPIEFSQLRFRALLNQRPELIAQFAAQLAQAFERNEPAAA